MTAGKTISGFKFKINETIFKDWDFLTLADAIKNNGSTMSNINKLITMFLGEKGFESLKEHVRKKLGYADHTMIENEFKEICSSAQVKN